ncbi:MAG TPA: outer membrane beta-barrel protein [Kofleriaceae bacterium]|jgi:hypothetical protein
MRWGLLLLAVGCRYYGSTTPRPRSSHVEAGAYAGVHVFSADNSLGSLRDSASFGARAGAFIGGHFGVEAQLAVTPTEASAAVYDVWVLMTEAHLVYEPLADTGDPRAVPFLYAGASAYDVVSSGGTPGTEITSGTLVAPDAGLGIKYPLPDDWGVRADATVVLPSSVDGGLTEDYELTLSIYRSFSTQSER